MGQSYITVTGTTQTISPQTSYIANNVSGVTFTLPTTAHYGDNFQIIGQLGLWVLAQNASQQVKLGANDASVGVSGSLVATHLGDCISAICITGGTNSVWRVYASIGNITVI